MRNFSRHNWPKVVIEPIKAFFSHGLPGWEMSRLGYDNSLLGVGYAEKMKKWNL
jgi:hypothetical protein